MATCPPRVRQFRSRHGKERHDCGSRGEQGGGRVGAREATRGQAMTIADLLESDEAKGLLETAQQAGAVNVNEIAGALDELELEPAVIGEFYAALDELDIEVVGRAVEEPEEADLDG